jgi:transcriptional regulator with XRE-family HTH domain
MLPQTKIEEVEKLLAEGRLSQRKISLLTGVSRAVISQVALGERPDYATRLEPAHDSLEPSGEIERCPTCGAKVYMPCRLCHLRSTRDEDTLQRYRRRAKQKASRRLLAAVVRRNQVQQAILADETRVDSSRTENP